MKKGRSTATALIGIPAQSLSRHAHKESSCRCPPSCSSVLPLPSRSAVRKASPPAGFSRGHRSIDGLEVRDDLIPSRLEEGRQHDLFTERRRVLVYREPGPFGRDLEEDAV